MENSLIFCYDLYPVFYIIICVLFVVSLLLLSATLLTQYCTLRCSTVQYETDSTFQYVTLSTI